MRGARYEDSIVLTKEIKQSVGVNGKAKKWQHRSRGWYLILKLENTRGESHVKTTGPRPLPILNLSTAKGLVKAKPKNSAVQTEKKPPRDRPYDHPQRLRMRHRHPTMAVTYPFITIRENIKSKGIKILDVGPFDAKLLLVHKKPYALA